MSPELDSFCRIIVAIFFTTNILIGIVSHHLYRISCHLSELKNKEDSQK